MQFITTFVTLFVTKFITKFGDSLDSSPNLVTNLVTNLSQKTLGLLVLFNRLAASIAVEASQISAAGMGGISWIVDVGLWIICSEI